MGGSPHSSPRAEDSAPSINVYTGVDTCNVDGAYSEVGTPVASKVEDDNSAALVGIEGRGDEDNSLEWVGWSADDVGDWVDQLLGLGVGEPFRQHGIDGPKLV